MYKSTAFKAIIAIVAGTFAYGENASAQSPNESFDKAYTVDGKTYQPKADVNFDRVGTASWYGSKFHGKLTANSERFDKNALTAAHKTLPFNSIVQVTNLASGKNVTVRINDRGPFHGNHEIDLSEAAAAAIGVTHQTSPALVRISIVKLNTFKALPQIPKSPIKEAREKSDVRTIIIKGKLVAANWSTQ